MLLVGDVVTIVKCDVRQDLVGQSATITGVNVKLDTLSWADIYGHSGYYTIDIDSDGRFIENQLEIAGS